MNKSTPRDLTQRLGLVVPQKWIPFSKDNINGPTVVEYRVPIFSNYKFYTKFVIYNYFMMIEPIIQLEMRIVKIVCVFVFIIRESIRCI
jgi:hypothetical protein